MDQLHVDNRLVGALLVLSSALKGVGRELQVKSVLTGAKSTREGCGKGLVHSVQEAVDSGDWDKAASVPSEPYDRTPALHCECVELGVVQGTEDKLVAGLDVRVGVSDVRIRLIWDKPIPPRLQRGQDECEEGDALTMIAYLLSKLRKTS